MNLIVGEEWTLAELYVSTKHLMSNWIKFSECVTYIENHFFTCHSTWLHYCRTRNSNFTIYDHDHDYPDDQGVDPIIYRDPLRSPQFDSTYLNNPSFVGSFEDPHFVYFFFRSSSRWWWWMNYDDAFGQGGWFYFVVMKSKEKNLTSLWSGRELLNIWTAASLSFLG